MQCLLYTTFTTARLQYIVSVLFNALGVQQYGITSNINDYVNGEGIKINYSPKPVAAKECWIKPAALLFEDDIKTQPVEAAQWNNLSIFFSTSTGDLPFDIFASSFYLLTRYEEYLPHVKDEYGRYAHTNSLAYKQGFLHQPLINFWVEELRLGLRQKFAAAKFNPPLFAYKPTYDIDMAWSYFSKGLIRNTGGLLRSVLKLNFGAIKDRVLVLLDLEDDPCDIYEWLDELHARHALPAVYFFLMAAKAGKYDKNVPPATKYFQLLLRKLSVIYSIGIHPSWQSGDEPGLIKTEKAVLENITGRKIVNSRQHYIRLQLPQTYRQLIAAGIQNDYSMGYGSINGYRASYCMPYKWFDVEKNEAADLTLFPFCYMEANSLFEQKLSADEALNELQHYYEVTKKMNGTLITIFHNHLLTLQPQQLAWRNMYEKFLERNF